MIHVVKRNGTTGMPVSDSADSMVIRSDAGVADNNDLFEGKTDMDYLDIPAFLRSQAD